MTRPAMFTQQRKAGLFLDDGDVRLYHGDALETLRGLPDGCVDMVATSPPFYGLRDYQVDGQIGLEETPDEWVTRLVAVFRECRRVLADHGTLWVEIGDSYANGSIGRNDADRNFTGGGGNRLGTGNPGGGIARSVPGHKPKDLLGQPWLLAFALRADGWYLRSEIIWARPNPMPESVMDRPTKSHSTVFLLSKQPRYFYDADAIREAFSQSTVERGYTAAKLRNGGTPSERQNEDVLIRQGKGWYDRAYDPTADLKRPQTETLDGSVGEAPRGPDGRRTTRVQGAENSEQHRDGERWPNPTGANARSVWTIPTEPTPFAHFATWPRRLVARMIQAGTSERGKCSECGKPWVRETASEVVDVPGGSRNGTQTHTKAEGDPLARANRRGALSVTTLGWSPSCACDGIDRRIVLTPTGERAGDDPSLRTGRAGMNRPRGDNEGRRPITRYEQVEYATQLRESPERGQMQAEAGEAFAHYIRTDDSGARPVPDELLDAWIGRGWLRRVEIPEGEPLAPVPCIVLDPFAGSGTTLLVARQHGRHAIGIELNEQYLKIAADRLAQLSLLTEAQA